MSKSKLKEVVIIADGVAVYDEQNRAHRKGEKVKLTDDQINHKNNRGNFRVNVQPKAPEKKEEK